MFRFVFSAHPCLYFWSHDRASFLADVNMDSPLAVCTKKMKKKSSDPISLDGRCVSGWKSLNSFTQYGDSALQHRSVNGLNEVFKCERISEANEEGRPSTSSSNKNIQQAREIVMANQLVIIGGVACSLQIQIIAIHSSLVHTVSETVIFTLYQLQGKWNYQTQISITCPQ